MMTRHLPRKNNSRFTYINCGIRITLRDNFIYCFSDFFLFKIFLSVFFTEAYHLILMLVLYDHHMALKFLILFRYLSLIIGNYSQTKNGLIITVILGIYFTILQGLEYYEARFTFADRTYGSTFFIATGFHGLHVIIGTLFLIVILYRHIILNSETLITLASKLQRDIDILLK